MVFTNKDVAYGKLQVYFKGIPTPSVSGSVSSNDSG